MNRLCDWVITTMKDNETMEINFLKNESRTMITFFLMSQSPNMFILGRYVLTKESGEEG